MEMDAVGGQFFSQSIVLHGHGLRHIQIQAFAQCVYASASRRWTSPPLSPGCLGKHGFHRGAHCVKVGSLLCVFYLLDGIRPEKSIQYGAVDKVSQQPPLYSKKYGCPAIDPVVIVKYLQVGFLYGIPSERQIERRIQTDIALRWYLGFDRVPDHSTVSQLRRRQPRDCFLLKCSRCGRICHLDCSHLKALYDHLERNHHFHIDPCGTLFTGLCELCVRDKDFHGTD